MKRTRTEVDSSAVASMIHRTDPGNIESKINKPLALLSPTLRRYPNRGVSGLQPIPSKSGVINLKCGCILVEINNRKLRPNTFRFIEGTRVKEQKHTLSMFTFKFGPRQSIPHFQNVSFHQNIMFWGWTDFKKRENIIRDDLDENATLTIAVDITIGTPQRQLKETNDELDFSSNAPILIDSGASVHVVPLDYRLKNERSTTNGVCVQSCTDHSMEAQATDELPLNLPTEERTAHKMKCNEPTMSVREAVKHGCVVVFGYGENKDAIICDQNDIEIIMTGPPLVTGKVGLAGGWYVSDYAIPSVDLQPGQQQQQSQPASSSSSSSMLSNKTKMMTLLSLSYSCSLRVRLRLLMLLERLRRAKIWT